MSIREIEMFVLFLLERERERGKGLLPFRDGG
jgi:hypothetical protein